MTEAVSYTIEDKLLKGYCNKARTRHQMFLNLINNQLSVQESELSDIVNKYSVFFAGLVDAVRTTASSDVALQSRGDSDHLLTAYSLHIASQTILKELDVSSSESNMGVAVQDTAEFNWNQMYKWGTTDYKAIKMGLEEMVHYIDASQKRPHESLKDFFEGYCSLTAGVLYDKLSPQNYKALSTNTWRIGDYELKGIHFNPPDSGTTGSRVTVPNSPVASHNDGGKQKFDTPLVPLDIPQNEVLPRNRIVGDADTLDFMEQLVIGLLLRTERLIGL